MKNLEIFETKQEYNKWLKELTESEKLLILEMMDEAREIGYEKGYFDSQKEACQEIRDNYHPNF